MILAQGLSQHRESLLVQARREFGVALGVDNPRQVDPGDRYFGMVRAQAWFIPGQHLLE